MFVHNQQECESGFQTNTTTFKITNARNIVRTDKNAKSSQQKCEETKMQSVCLYAITITSKLGILSSSAKYNANVHRTQISSTDNKEIYIH